MDKTRVLQLIVRTLAVLLVGKLGMDAQTAQPVSQMIGEGALAGVLAGVDQLMHLKFFISMKAHLEALENAGSDQTGSGGTTATAPTTGGTPVPQVNLGEPSKLRSVVILLLGAGLLLAVTGCATSAKNQIAQAYTSIDATAQTATALVKAKTISPAAAQKVLDAVQVANAAVDAWDAARSSGNATLEQTTQQAALAAVAQLGVIVNAATAATQPATQP